SVDDDQWTAWEKRSSCASIAARTAGGVTSHAQRWPWGQRSNAQGRQGASDHSTLWRCASSGAQRQTSLPEAMITLGWRRPAAMWDTPVSLLTSRRLLATRAAMPPRELRPAKSWTS